MPVDPAVLDRILGNDPLCDSVALCGPCDHDLDHLLAVTAALATARAVKEIAMESFQPEVIALVRAVLVVNPAIEAVVVRNYDCTDDAVLKLVEALRASTTLRSFSFSAFYGTEAVFMALAGALKSNSTLTSFSLEVFGVEELPDGVGLAFAGALRANTTLRSFSLRAEFGSDAAFVALAVGLKSNSTLTSFSFGVGWGELTDDVGRALEGALRANTTLRSFSSSANFVSGAAYVALAAALKSNLTLTSFSLEVRGGYAEIVEVAAPVALADALKSNSTLTSFSLDVMHGQLTDDVERALAGALRANTTLRSFSLRGSEGCVALAGALASNSTLTSFSLTIYSTRGVATDADLAWADALRTNTTLRSFSLQAHSVWDEVEAEHVGLAFAEALRTNTTLKCVSFIHNHRVGSPTALAECHERNRALPWLYWHLSAMSTSSAAPNVQEVLKDQGLLLAVFAFFLFPGAHFRPPAALEAALARRAVALPPRRLGASSPRGEGPLCQVVAPSSGAAGATPTVPLGAAGQAAAAATSGARASGESDARAAAPAEAPARSAGPAWHAGAPSAAPAAARSAAAEAPVLAEPHAEKGSPRGDDNADLAEALLRSKGDLPPEGQPLSGDGVVVLRLTCKSGYPQVAQALSGAPALAHVHARVAEAGGCPSECPAWLFVPITDDQLREAGLDLKKSHILCLQEDVKNVRSALSGIRCKDRPGLAGADDADGDGSPVEVEVEHHFTLRTFSSFGTPPPP